MAILSGCTFFEQNSGSTQTDPKELICPPVPSCPICPVTACPEVTSVEKPIKPSLRDNGSESLSVVGGVEWVTLTEPKLRFRARVDTGAETSSIHAENVLLFEREGKRWVRFTIPNGDQEPVTLERRLRRKVLIKRHQDQPERRYVVRMRLEMGVIQERVEVTLSNRSNMSYPVLIGRNFLTDTAVVDVSRKYTFK